MTVYLDETAKKDLEEIARKIEREPAWLARKYILEGLARDKPVPKPRKAKK